ncbi:MAG: DNA polymerase III subunit delta' [Phycisphaerae bacterium]|nr:DNA polymerase III subunit delta' [Phycisphaerae bacterium]
MSLKNIFCQERAIGALQRAMNAGRLAHAYIFAGPAGVGKRTTAQAWAKMLLCRERRQEKATDLSFNDSCGRCESCRVFEGGGHPDYHLIEKELRPFTMDDKGKEAKQDLPIAVVREFLIDKVAHRPVMSECTVYVLREAERLNASSQNALLKVLEEPPKHCFIILLCSRADRLLPTTQSRCQIVRFGPVDEPHIVAALTEKGVDKTQAQYWARLSEGSMGEALGWATLAPKGSSCYEIKRQLVDSLAKHRLEDSLELAAWMGDAASRISGAWSDIEPQTSKTDLGRRAAKGLLRMVVAVYSDVMKLHAGQGDQIVNADQTGPIEALARRIDAEQSAEKIAKVYENIRWVEASVNEKLIFEELLLNLAGSRIISA